jgi:hypothetical protein
MAVHDIDMDDVGVSGHLVDRPAQGGEIGRQDRRADQQAVFVSR